MPNTERERRISMLRAALPYTAGHQRHALDLLLQADTLINTVRGGTANDLEACEAEAQPEEMLLHMQEFCTPRESDMVQMALNFIKAGHLFRNYREFVASHASSGMSEDLQAAGIESSMSNPLQMLFQLLGGLGGIGSTNGNTQMVEFLLTQLSPDQRQLFEQLRGFSGESFHEGQDRKEANYDNMETE